MKYLKSISLILLIAISSSNLSLAQSSYSQQSGFLPNPREYDGDYTFDYGLDLRVKINDREYPTKIWFNSADGTIGITDYTFMSVYGSFDMFGMEEFHQGVLFPDGKVLLYGLVEDYDGHLKKTCLIIENTAMAGQHFATSSRGVYNPSLSEVERNQNFQERLDNSVKSQGTESANFGSTQKYENTDDGVQLTYEIADRESEVVFSPEIIALTGFGIPFLYKDHKSQKNRIVTRTQMQGDGHTYTFTISQILPESGGGITIDGQGYEEQHMMQFDADGGGFSAQHESATRQLKEIMEREDLSTEEKEALMKKLMNEKLRR